MSFVGLLYRLLYSTGIVGDSKFLHGIIMYDISKQIHFDTDFYTCTLLPHLWQADEPQGDAGDGGIRNQDGP